MWRCEKGALRHEWLNGQQVYKFNWSEDDDDRLIQFLICVLYTANYNYKPMKNQEKIINTTV
jgi:hypothetical protein